MTDSLWQTVVVGVALALAISYLIWRTWKRRRLGAGCAKCPAANAGRRRS